MQNIINYRLINEYKRAEVRMNFEWLSWQALIESEIYLCVPHVLQNNLHLVHSISWSLVEKRCHVN